MISVSSDVETDRYALEWDVLSSWWEWDTVSRCLFWGCHKFFQWAARDGQNSWVTVVLMGFTKNQIRVKDEDQRSK